jgi:hypothetical protein
MIIIGGKAAFVWHRARRLRRMLRRAKGEHNPPGNHCLDALGVIELQS